RQDGRGLRRGGTAHVEPGRNGVRSDACDRAAEEPGRRSTRALRRLSKAILGGMAHLFEPLTVRGVTFLNRVFVSPMCEYSSRDGFANDWHFVHLGSRAVGGAGLVFTEAAAVTADGRISAVDLGIYSDAHVEPLARIFRFIEEQG